MNNDNETEGMAERNWNRFKKKDTRTTIGEEGGGNRN